MKPITTVRVGGRALVFGFRATPTWVAIVGLAVACAEFVGMFRNVTAVVAPVASINNYLLPLWMIVFGVVLLRHRLPDPQVAGA